MKILILVTLILLGKQLIVHSITVTSSINKNNVTILTPLEKNSTEIFDRSDRHRRLIPYMTYYIPSDDYNLPQNQAYNFAPIKSQQQKQIHQKQLEEKLDPILYQNQRPQISAIVYNTRHQAHKPYNLNQPTNYENYRQIQQQPQLNKLSQTLFHSNNKLPGQFLPIGYIQNENNIQYTVKPQTVTNKPQIEIRPSSRPQYHLYNVNNHPTEQKYVNNYGNPQNYINYQKSTPTAVIKHIPYTQRLPITQNLNSKEVHGIQVPYQDENVQYYSPPFGSEDYVMRKPNVYYQNPIIIQKPVKTVNNPILFSTVAPFIRVSTQVPNYQTSPRIPVKYQDSTIQQYRPTVTPPPLQHLTETTQIQPPTLSTHYPSKIPQKAVYQKQVIQRYRPIPKPSIPKIIVTTPKPVPNYNPNSLSDILRKLQESNHLPHTLTPDNIDNSIRTLVKILNELKQSQKVAENPSQHQVENDYDYHDPASDDDDDVGSDLPGPNSGRPGIEYPNLSQIPHTSFSCKEQRYKGFFGDPETSCQVWHYCDLNGGQASFLCPNGTIFSQIALTCDWWFNVKCSSTAQLYVLNERLYKYILPFTPKFPEDYSGPLVDKYLALKFQEMEEKMRKEKKAKEDNPDDEDSDEAEEEEDEIGGEVEQEIKDYSTTENTKATTIMVLPSHSTIENVRTTVESEKLELIEIKPDGNSGHIIPIPNYDNK